MRNSIELRLRHGAPEGPSPEPRRVAEDEAEIAAGDVATETGPNIIESKIMPKARILVVDDDRVQREMLKNILTLGGYDVVTAAGGQEALEALVKMDGTIILSDLKMPGMDGMELLTETRKRFPDTTFIMITAHPSPETREEALRKGARVYLAKPLDIEELYREIAHALKQ